MINFFCYSHLLQNLKLIVQTAADQRKNVELNYELPHRKHNFVTKSSRQRNKGEPILEYFQKFKLQPNTYVFSLKLHIYGVDLKENHVRLK